jgi:hypothetical protein
MMVWLEIIHLKPYTGRDWDGALAAFDQLTAPDWNANIKEIDLYKSPKRENGLSILINWKGDLPAGGKSGLGMQLARAFAEFGYIHHSGWRFNSRLLPVSSQFQA